MLNVEETLRDMIEDVGVGWEKEFPMNGHEVKAVQWEGLGVWVFSQDCTTLPSPVALLKKFNPVLSF